jgi:RNA polymerase sigma factor (sigma-70 family)
MLSDCQLLQDYAERGSQDAFRQLVCLHLPLVYRSALRQVSFDVHRAQDVAQEVFVALARQSRALVRHPNLSAWLYATTHRAACQSIRTEMRRRQREHAWAEGAATGTSAGEWPAVAAILDESVRALRPADRDAIVLRFFGSRSFAEIGGTLRISEDAARMRVNRALEALRDRFRAKGVAINAAGLASLLATDTAMGAPAELTVRIASAAAGVAPLAAPVATTVVSFMAGTKFIATLTGVAAAIAVGLATQQWTEARLASADLESTRAEVMAWQARLATRRGNVAASTPARRTVADTSPSAEDPWLEFAEADAFLSAHPEVREALVKRQRAAIRGKCLPLYVELHLTEAQIEEFERLAMGASARPWNGHGLWVGDHYLPPERDERLRALLGDQGFAKLRAARLPNSGEAVVEKLAAQLAVSDEPLTAVTSLVVRDVVDQVHASNVSTADAWPEILARLTDALTPFQLDELKALAAGDRYRRAMAVATQP